LNAKNDEIIILEAKIQQDALLRQQQDALFAQQQKDALFAQQQKDAFLLEQEAQRLRDDAILRAQQQEAQRLRDEAFLRAQQQRVIRIPIGPPPKFNANDYYINNGIKDFNYG
jgi:hypothetical protein